ncbi:hypothetical protein [Rubritalea sp.]|uniref:hypothetical protein n=1 Tax=Rubritalea sp. TaxID=2109375 RepID=UPI003EF682BA
MKIVFLSCLKVVCALLVLGGLSSCGLFGLNLGSSPEVSQSTETVLPKETDDGNISDELIKPVEHTIRPIAEPVPGRAGYVINPFTGNIVDVRGLSAGILVRDPQDPEKANSFRVPAFE